MRPQGPAAVLEDRRRRAMKLLDTGLSLHEVARRIDCAASSVMRWRDARQRGGTRALKVKTTPGRPHKLSAKQKARLIKLLLRGPTAHGYSTELWTTARIAEVISDQFDVRYHRDHVGRLMHTLGWSCQVPQRRARQRDEARIQQWRAEDWPRVKKTLRGWAPTSSSSMRRASS